MTFKTVDLDDTKKRLLADAKELLGCPSVMILGSDSDGTLHVLADSSVGCGDVAGKATEAASEPEVLQVSVEAYKRSALESAGPAVESFQGQAIQQKLTTAAACIRYRRLDGSWADSCR
jgi:hypothetical protein